MLPAKSSRTSPRIHLNTKMQSFVHGSIFDIFFKFQETTRTKMMSCLFTLFWLLEGECEFILVFLPCLPLSPLHFQSETSLSAQTHFITSGNVDAKMNSIRIQDRTCSVKSQETTFSTRWPAVQSSEQRPIRPIRWWVRTFPTVADAIKDHNFTKICTFGESAPK